MEPGTSGLTPSAESSEQRKKRRASGEAEREEAKKSKQDYSPEKSTGETPLVPKAGTSNPNASEYIQMVVTGPPGCGKSSLVLSWLREFNPHYKGNRLVFNKQHLIEVNSKRCMIWDLDTRSAKFKQYRLKSYKECDITFLCFHNARLIKKSSNSDLYALLSKYINDFKHIRQDSGPIILVGIEKDGDKESQKFSEGEINYLRGTFKNIKSYKEISTSSNTSIDILHEAINLVKHPKIKEMFATGGFEVSDLQPEVTTYLCD